MSIINFLKTLEPNTYTYTGDQDSPLRGFTLSGQKHLYLLVTDQQWPRRLHRTYLDPEGKAAARIKTAIARGTQGFIVPSSQINEETITLLEGQNVVVVEDTFKLLFAITKFIHAQENRGMITAVTGSAGKSTTCAMLKHALDNSTSGRVLKPIGNRNLYEQIAGLVSRSVNYAHVIPEVAISSLREYKNQGFSIGADVSIVTSITAAHSQTLNSTEDIAEFKAGVFDDPPPGGTAVINLDTMHADLLVKRAIEAGRQIVTYGENPEANIRLVSYNPDTHEAIAIFGNEAVTYRIGAAGKHMAINSLAVLATLRAYRIRNWRSGLQSLASFQPIEGRGDVFTIDLQGTQLTIIDESYNANAASMTAAIESFAEVQPLNQGTRKIAVLGDILELGKLSKESHLSLAPVILKANLHKIFLFGPEMAVLAEELTNIGVEATHSDNLMDIMPHVLEGAMQGDQILLKASGDTGLKDYVKSSLRPLSQI